MPFRLKVADHPYRFARRDAAVLYLAADAFRERRRELVDLARGLAPAAGRPRVHARARARASGSPRTRDGESFGMARRCALLAEAIVVRTSGRRRGRACARFAEDGVDLDAPYLEPARGRHVL